MQNKPQDDGKLMVLKEGLPEEGELVMCTITKIYPTSVFAILDEYEKQGMIHISEISPGRIRNIHDYVKEGKKVVCKVLRLDKQKGHIDLSLRRVSESQRREKVNEMKQEQKAEKIIEFVAAKQKIPVRDLYQKISSKAFKDHPGIYPFFEEIVANNKKINEFSLPENVSKELLEVILQRIKPPQIELKGKLSLKTYDSQGIEKVKEALHTAQEVFEDAKIAYLGGGRYSISVISEDIKEADKILTSIVEAAIGSIQKSGGNGSFERADAEQKQK